MLTTSQAAARLGCTRQHVVDLCDRGDLPFVKVGTHRRIRERDLPHRLTEDQRRSLWYHHAVAGALVADPETVLGTANANLDAWMAKPGNRAAPWLRQWRTILDGGVDAVLDVITAPTQRAADLRQSTPFAGVLPADERARVLRRWFEQRPAA